MTKTRASIGGSLLTYAEGSPAARFNCSVELAELVVQELPLVLKAAVAGVGGCQPGGDVKAGLVSGTGPRQGSQRPRRGRRVVRSC